jgi:hypothetical protein
MHDNAKTTDSQHFRREMQTKQFEHQDIPSTAEMGKINEGVTSAFDTVIGANTVKSPQRAQDIKTVAGQLMAANPSLSPEDAIRGAISVTQKGATEIDNGNLKLPNGVMVKAPQTVIDIHSRVKSAAAPTAAPTAQPETRSWGR